RPGLCAQRAPGEARRSRAEQQLRLRRPEHLAGRQPLCRLALLDRRSGPCRGCRPFFGAASVCWWCLVLAVLSGLLLAPLLAGLAFHLWILRKFGRHVVRIFTEMPVFVFPRGQPIADAEDFPFPTGDGLTLRGCYLRSQIQPRRGVILFGLEFGSNRWA